jgi:transposase-like protein
MSSMSKKERHPVSPGGDGVRGQGGRTHRGSGESHLPEGPKRRTFTAEYKLRIVREADAALASGVEGAVGELLHREGLYSSHLTTWRREREEGQLAGLTPKKRDRKPQRNLEADELARLQRENARLQHELTKANTVIEVQRQVAALLGKPCRRRRRKTSRERRRCSSPVDSTSGGGDDRAGSTHPGGRHRRRVHGAAREPSEYYRAQKPVAPRRLRPRPARALSDEERTPGARGSRQRPVHEPGAGAGLCQAARGRRVPVLAKDDVPRARHCGTDPRTSCAASSSRVHQAAGPTRGTYYTL